MNYNWFVWIARVAALHINHYLELQFQYFVTRTCICFARVDKNACLDTKACNIKLMLQLKYRLQSNNKYHMHDIFTLAHHGEAKRYCDIALYTKTFTEYTCTMDITDIYILWWSYYLFHVAAHVLVNSMMISRDHTRVS